MGEMAAAVEVVGERRCSERRLHGCDEGDKAASRVTFRVVRAAEPKLMACGVMDLC